jgi:DNA-binding XRE family transcriptional regulator
MSENTHERVIAMRAQGVSDRKIADALGLTRQRIHRIAGPRQTDGRFGPRSDTPPPPPIEHAMALREWRERHSLTQAQAGALIGVNTMTVSRWERNGECSVPSLLLAYIEMYDIIDMLATLYDNGSLLPAPTLDTRAAKYLDDTMQFAKTLIDIG